VFCYSNIINEDEIAKGKFITAENLKKEFVLVIWNKAAQVQLQDAFNLSPINPFKLQKK
jgi:hypothetical protein